MSDPTKKQKQLRAVDLTVPGEGDYEVKTTKAARSPFYIVRAKSGGHFYQNYIRANAIAVCAALNAVSREETP